MKPDITSNIFYELIRNATRKTDSIAVEIELRRHAAITEYVSTVPLPYTLYKMFIKCLTVITVVCICKALSTDYFH